VVAEVESVLPMTETSKKCLKADNLEWRNIVIPWRRICMLNTTVERVHIFLQHFTSYYRKFQLRSILQIFNLLIGNTKGKCQFSKTILYLWLIALKCAENMTTCNYEIIDKFVFDDFHCVVH
jgi:hypothetical protein